MSKVVTEHVLKIVDGDQEQGVFSHASEALVRGKALSLAHEHLEHGRQIPPYQLTRRTVTYPTDKNGAPIANGSTVEETELELGL